MAFPTDLTQRFLLENLDIRGQVVRLGPLWRAILACRDYPEPMRPLLAEFAALAVLIATGLKHPGRVVLQVMGHGPVSMAVADCTQELALRAMLKVDPSFPPSLSPFPRRRESGLQELPALFADGRLTLTIENHASARHFQSIVPLEGATLAECFEHYFDRSEEKVVSMLRGLGRAEVEATLAEHGVVTVHDEICNQEYHFTAPDIVRIFAG